MVSIPVTAPSCQYAPKIVDDMVINLDIILRLRNGEREQTSCHWNRILYMLPFIDINQCTRGGHWPGHAPSPRHLRCFLTPRRARPVSNESTGNRKNSLRGRQVVTRFTTYTLPPPNPPMCLQKWVVPLMASHTHVARAVALISAHPVERAAHRYSYVKVG